MLINFVFDVRNRYKKDNSDVGDYFTNLKFIKRNHIKFYSL